MKAHNICVIAESVHCTLWTKTKLQIDWASTKQQHEIKESNV